MKPQHDTTLITNLEYVTIVGCDTDRPVKTYCHALVIQRGADPLDNNKRRYQLRGFGVSASLPVFEMELQSAEFSKIEIASSNFMINDGALRPLCSGVRLSFEGGPLVDLIRTVCSDQPIHFEDLDNIDLWECWELLRRRVASYWTGPNMPSGDYVPADWARQALRAPKAGSQ